MEADTQIRWPKQVRDIVIAIVFTLAPWGFSVPIVWSCIMWTIAWLAVLWLVFVDIEILWLASRRIGTAVLVTVVVVYAVTPPIRSAYRKEKSSALTGDLVTVVDDGKDHSSDPPVLQIGTSQTLLTWPSSPVEYASYRDRLNIERINGKLYLTMQVRDHDGNAIVEIAKNHWTVSKSNCWDKNYNDDTLEVKDGKNRVVLQVRLLPDVIQLQVEWQDRGDVHGGISQRGQYDVKKGLKPLFKYPSELFWGQFADARQPW